GQHLVSYTIVETSTGAERTEPRFIRVNEVPNINFSVLNNCIVDTINFVDLSVLDNGDFFNDAIEQWDWKIGEGPDFISTSQNPKIKFDENKPGTYKVILTATTKFNCTASKTSNPGDIEIGVKPNPEFIINNLTFGELSEFMDKTIIPTQSNYPSGFSDPTKSIDSIWWNFGEGNPVSGTYDEYSIAFHQFSQGNQEYQVSMRIKTDLGCYAVDTIPVSVIQSINVFPYEEDFENFNSQAFRGDSASWQLMVPNGYIIKGDAGNKAWVTSNIDNRHNDNEHSFVALPAFDLRSLLRPMISVDIWANAENTRDGAVLQYSYNGGSWFTLVDQNENIARDSKEQIGLNWYNEKGLVSRPGDGTIEGTSGDNGSGYGWTGVNTNWRTARFPLDEIRDNQPAGASSVRFRVVFSSDQQNPDGTNYDGFAFDNLWIGEREHNVLFEHFDNLNSNTAYKGDSVNLLAQKFTLDLIPIQYHNNYPNEDVIYLDNKYPVETRGSIYNITQSPRSFMDGIKEYDYSGSHVRDYQIIN
ncbi:MAG: hypothetical protein KAQ79_23095, partial [Cyclobacteriaceae bacterium]|nr:hypothetical protein [Cyclobacteriaceae bacterium]